MADLPLIEPNLDKIILDPRLQGRAAVSQNAVEDFAGMWARGDRFPPVDVFDVPADLARNVEAGRYLADGWHRYLGKRLWKKRGTIRAYLHHGTWRDALLFALAANQKYSVERKPEDKRRVVNLLLDDPEWARWSNVAIAEHCGVSPGLVADVRKERAELSSHGAKMRTAQRGAATYEMDVSAIGKRESEAIAEEGERAKAQAQAEFRARAGRLADDAAEWGWRFTWSLEVEPCRP